MFLNVIEEGAMSNRLWLYPLVLTSGLCLTTGVRAERGTQNEAPANSPLENTERNARDIRSATVTPEDQTESRGDRELTASIRRTVVNDKALSMNAHNAKIITRNGVVTLRGPVESSGEKSKLQAIAHKTRGVRQVDNQLEIKTP
jgi:hyperosmotically inducible periplasmic protein